MSRLSRTTSSKRLTAAVHRFGGFPTNSSATRCSPCLARRRRTRMIPSCALRAALGHGQSSGVKRVGERSHARLNAPLTLHIGVNTGPVVAGGIGAGSAKSYSVTGDTVNTAQRLQSMASPGEVLVGPLAYRLTRHAFAYESLGEASLRGKTGSVLVHRLRAPLDLPRAARGLETVGLAAPLIGRDAELAHMVGSLEPASGGAAQIVRLIGEAGIGKTRLVDEFLARVSATRSASSTLRFGGLCACCSASSPSARSLRSCGARTKSTGTHRPPKRRCGSPNHFRNWG